MKRVLLVIISFLFIGCSIQQEQIPKNNETNKKQKKESSNLVYLVCNDKIGNYGFFTIDISNFNYQNSLRKIKEDNNFSYCEKEKSNNV